jgi:HD-like signal output (HDOD) protein
MMHVLIVGADPAPVVGGGPFDTYQVPTGVEAISQLSTRPVDVIVVRRTTADGAGRELLLRLKDEWPAVVRVRELDDGEEGVRPDPHDAHHVLPPAFNAAALERALLDAAELRSRLDHRLVVSLVKTFGGLPSAPGTWTELTRQLAHPLTASVPAIAATIERDVALTAQLLRQANSALLARGRRLTSVQDAIVRLGFHALQHLVLGAETSRLFARATEGGVSVEALSDEGLERGLFAASLVTRRDERPAAFVAGMMLEVGQLVSACYLPGQTRQLRAMARARGWTLDEAEAVTWGVTHADIGAHLLEAWNLPPAAVEAAARHHEPPTRGGLIDAVTAARVARFVLPSGDPLDAVEELSGWQVPVELATRMMRSAAS